MLRREGTGVSAWLDLSILSCRSLAVIAFLALHERAELQLALPHFNVSGVHAFAIDHVVNVYLSTTQRGPVNLLANASVTTKDY